MQRARPRAPCESFLRAAVPHNAQRFRCAHAKDMAITDDQLATPRHRVAAWIAIVDMDSERSSLALLRRRLLRAAALPRSVGRLPRVVQHLRAREANRSFENASDLQWRGRALRPPSPRSGFACQATFAPHPTPGSRETCRAGAECGAARRAMLAPRP